MKKLIALALLLAGVSAASVQAKCFYAGFNVPGCPQGSKKFCKSGQCSCPYFWNGSKLQQAHNKTTKVAGSTNQPGETCPGCGHPNDQHNVNVALQGGAVNQ